MTRGCGWLLGATMAGLLASPLAGHAAERLHVASRGESFESVARDYYDRETLAALIASHNELAGHVLREGSELRIPLGELHVVTQGESWAGLAQRSLGEAALADDLARLNDRTADDALRPGQRVVLPALAIYRMQSGDFLRSLARRFYGSAGRARLLERVNKVDDPRRLFVGRVMKIPVMTVGSDSIPREAPAVTRSGGKPATDSELDSELRAAIDAFLEGRYTTALESLEGLRSRVLADGTPKEQRLLLRHLTFVYVAWDRRADACGSVRELRAIEPRPDWNPELVSPKIRRVVDSCDDR